jgi:GntR family transcriptional regulator, glv operon transcriptional regulator
MIYKSIAERLRIRLNSADFTLNSLLPGEKKLAEEFAVSRMTIRKAIDLLVAWGLVVRRHGSGTYLVRKDVLHQTASLTGLVEVLKRQGKTVTSQALAFANNLHPTSGAAALSYATVYPLVMFLRIITPQLLAVLFWSIG